MDEINELRKEVAYRRWKLTGCCDMGTNWREAGKIVMHFLDRRQDQAWWRADHEDLQALYGDLIYGK
jgi:hypothetical protein